LKTLSSDRRGLARPAKRMADLEPAVKKLYSDLVRGLKKLGPFEEEHKKSSIHLIRKSAFAGVHPRKQWFMLTIKAAKPIDSDRIAKSEQVSKSRWHEEVKIAQASDIDAELIGWLREAYELCG
jgi:hypothetical protein